MEHAFLTDDFKALLAFGAMTIEIRLKEQLGTRCELTQDGWLSKCFCGKRERLAALMECERDIDMVEARLHWGEFVVASEPMATVAEAIASLFPAADNVRADRNAAAYARMLSSAVEFVAAVKKKGQ